MTLDIGYGQTWQVSGEGGGSMNLDDALAHSINTVFAQLGLDVGPENFDAMAHKLGVTSKLQAVPAEAIGGTAYCCTVLEMADAYATLANGGVHHKPTAIASVKFPDGKADKPEPRGRPRDQRRRRVHGRSGAQGAARVRHRGRAGHPVPGRRQDRYDRTTGGRVVRRRHAAHLDRGLDGQPG